MPESIERFGLYGEPVRHVEPHFIHVEPIRDRSGSHGWQIAPHVHGELHQLLLVAKGGGTMQSETTHTAILPPALLVVPAGTVHGFAFEPGTDGWVISIAEAALPASAVGDGAVLAMLDQPRCVGPIAPGAEHHLDDCFLALSNELAWDGAGRRLAIEAEVSRLLVAFLRSLSPGEDAVAALSDAEARLLSRFRALVEAHYGDHLGIAAYARRLAVSEDRLLALCRKRFDASPIQIVHRRLLVEAQRMLLYTNTPIGGVSEELGFGDVGYFSRFFSKRMGRSPRQFRAEAKSQRGGAASDGSGGPGRTRTGTGAVMSSEL